MQSKPNVILIIMDAVRADHLSCYGYHRKTSPNIDRIAMQGALFENAFSAAEWSPPSHASMFTGKYPSHHKTLGVDLFLKKGNVTLGEVLSQNGYETIGVTCNTLLGSENRFNKGFQKYIEMYNGHLLNFKWLKNPRAIIRSLIYGPDMDTYRANEMIKGFIKSRRIKSKPFFLFVNYMSCHHPYDPPRPFKERFCRGFDESRLYIIEFFLNKFFGKTTRKIDDESLDIRKLQHIASGRGFIPFMRKKLQISEKEWNIVKSWYDGEIAYLDKRIGELFNLLCDEDVFNRTLLIVTSDHGELFGEHGLACHGSGLYDGLLHVPLIVTYPDAISGGERISNIVSTIDIFPTVLDVLNIKEPMYEIQGRSLYPFQERRFHDFICADCGMRKNPNSERLTRGYKCLRTDTHKYVLSSDRTEELYDIHHDPLEQIDISQKFPEKVKYFRNQLEKTLGTSYFGLDTEQENRQKISANMERRLRALGYI